MPRLSVIMPAHNAEAHLAQALDSVEAQTYRDWEVVIADDGSTDRTFEIGTGYENMIVVRNEGPRGPASARNAAVARASGQLLAFLDADDYWLEDFLERQVALYDESTAAGQTVGVVACDARILGPAGFLPHTYLDYIGRPREIDLRRLLVSNPIYVSAVTPHAVFDEAGGFCIDLFGTEDYDLWMRIVELGYRVVVSQRALAVYRLGEGSVSSHVARMAENERLVFERALARGNLTEEERRLARRQIRRRQAIERIATDGASPVRLLRSLPLLVRVAVENPGSWRSLPRLLTRGRGALSARFGLP